MGTADTELCYTDAVTLVARLRDGELSARELMQAFLARIDALNPAVNAICTRVPDATLLAAADVADAARSGGAEPGPLHGLPVAVKDLALTRGIRTTFGSLILADNVPAEDQIFVERLRRAGAILVGKTNVPEFGAGSQTFNPLFGVTRNPYDLGKTAGGSSGGAAAALAAGLLPLADGSDLGGSLRNPASFCNVVGFRPSPGRVPSWPVADPFSTLAVEGPMARTVADCALLLSVMAGPDPRVPIALETPGAAFAAPLERDLRGVRIAYTPDLGRYPVAAGVRDVCAAALPVFARLGCEIEEATPDMSGADDAFQILRAHLLALTLGTAWQTQRERMKGTLRWNIERGLALSSADLRRAQAERTALYQRMIAFLGRYEYLLLPTVQVLPFDAETEWVQEIDGAEMHTYIDWMASCYAITLTALPAISVPAGFSPEGLPVGIQIVGRRHADFQVLQLAHAFEQATRHTDRRPPLG